jgi:hypothetical protein
MLPSAGANADKALKALPRNQEITKQSIIPWINKYNF